MALATGAEFVGEGFILLVSGGVVVFEYNRTNKVAAEKERQKQEKAKLERDTLNASLKALDIRLQSLEKVVLANSQQIAVLSNEPAGDAKPSRSLAGWGIFGL